jgi:hypothetical protein
MDILLSILAQVREKCEYHNVKFSDFLKCCIADEYGFFDYDNINDEKELEFFTKSLETDYDLIWDLQPAIEDDEEHAFAVQHARDIYDILLGRF